MKESMLNVFWYEYRYEEKCSLKKYTDSRWNNTTFPIIISQRELTEEEKDYLTQNSKFG